jgi:hypothetical protein
MSVQGIGSGSHWLLNLLTAQAPASASSPGTDLVAGSADVAAPAAATVGGSANESGAASPNDQFTSDFATFIAAVRSGDMPGAQKALKAIQNDAVTVQGAGYSGGHRRSRLVRDFQALIDAVNQSDATGAQSALSTLQTDLTSWAGRHASPGGSAPATIAQLQNPAAADFKALADAVTAGDTAGAQTALAKLQSDLAAGGTQRHHHHHHRGRSAAGGSSGTQGVSVSAALSSGGDQDHDGDSR